MTAKKGLRRGTIGVLGALAIFSVLAVSTLSLVWAESGTIGSSGGTLSFADGSVSLNFKEGATSADTAVSYDALTDSTAPEGSAFGSQVFTLSATIDGVAQTMAQFVEITVKYTDADVVAAGGRDTDVQLYLYDSAFKTWNVDGSAIQDVVNQTITTNQTTLGSMAIVTAGPVVVAVVEEPATGGIAPGSALLIVLALLGGTLVFGGVRILNRNRMTAS